MKTFIFVLLPLLMTCFTDAVPSQIFSAREVTEDWEKNPLITRETDPNVLQKLRGLRQRVIDTGCNPNLCFALQGDDFISDDEFESQKNFIDIIIAILTTDNPGNYCAVQYGLTTTPISPLTGNKRQFLKDLRKATRVGGFDTNIAASLGYTGFQLRSQLGDANKVIILGDGLENIGFKPKRVARRMREDGTDICAVAVGGYSTEALLEIVGGDSNKIGEVAEFFDLAEVIYGFITDVCGFKDDSSSPLL